MHVLILFSQPWRVGGAETHVEALIAGLSPTHKITLVTNQGGTKEKLEALCRQYPNLAQFTIQTRGCNPFRWFFDLQKLIGLVKEEKIEVISAQQRTAGLWAYFIQKKTKVPFVVTMHDAWHRVHNPQNYAKIFQRMIVVSKNLSQRLINDFGFSADSIFHIPNGIDFNKFAPGNRVTARKKLGIGEKITFILHVSRLSSIKGAVALTLLESVPQLVALYPNCRIGVIGEGPLRSEVDAKVQSLNERYGPVVTVMNFTADLLTWYWAADVVVGEGRVAIEALACLKPVVAIRNAQTFFGAVSAQNINEAIQVNFDGHKLKVSPQELTVQIQKALTLPAQERQQILEVIQSRMSAVVMAEQYLQVFETCLRETQNGKCIAH